MSTANTHQTYQTKGIREDLADVIYNISPEETPFTTMIGRGPRTHQTFTEWQTDSLAAPDTTNARVEGADATYSRPAPTVRVGNYTQISDKTLQQSETNEVVDKAGRRSEQAYQLAKRGAELKLDMESIFLTNQGADAGSSDTPRKLASMAAWLKSNVNKGATGADPDYTSGAPTKARTDGTQRAFTEGMLKAGIQQVWSRGGKPKILMVGAYNKTVVSTFEGLASHTIDVTKAAPTMVVASVDVYVSDFGNVRVVPNRWQRERDAWLLDPEMATVRYLRPFKRERLAKTGDAVRHQLIVEYTLQVKQEAGLGLIADLTTSAA